MSKVSKILQQMKRSPAGVSFQDLCKACEHYFGEPRQSGGSHRVYRTPWPGDPRVVIQPKGGKGKAYQVRQVLKAIAKLEETNGS